jgi:hypothetical protein
MHVLADGGDQVGDQVLNRGPVQRGSVHGVDLGVVERHDGDLVGGVLEQFVAGDEVGFRVELDDGGALARALMTGGDGDQTFGGDAVSLLGGLGQALGAQPVDGGVDVAVGFLKRLLAVHHADAGFFAQFLDERSGDLSHEMSPWG